MKLDDTSINQRLAAVPEWSRHADTIRREYKFADFKTAFAFMAEVAESADQLNHHPEWTNVYNRVRVTLSTHDVGGLSELDFKLAAIMDQAAHKQS